MLASSQIQYKPQIDAIPWNSYSFPLLTKRSSWKLIPCRSAVIDYILNACIFSITFHNIRLHDEHSSLETHSFFFRHRWMIPYQWLRPHQFAVILLLFMHLIGNPFRCIQLILRYVNTAMYSADSIIWYIMDAKNSLLGTCFQSWMFTYSLISNYVLACNRHVRCAYEYRERRTS